MEGKTKGGGGVNKAEKAGSKYARGSATVGARISVRMRVCVVLFFVLRSPISQDLAGREQGSVGRRGVS